ncbi:MAG: hypothetical protein IFK91_05980 [Acidobacteria bacterium]|nr:hypothetical protein [Candidatus Sulfomarinibacter sp. MAG AM1]
MTGIKTKELGIGIFLLVTFAAVMVMIFMPILDGGNALNYLDNLYNSISKGSAYYIPKVEHLVEEHGSEAVTLNLKLDDTRAALAAEPLFARAGTTTAVEGATLMVSGDIETIFGTCLEDAESAYHNRGEDLAARYGADARTTLHNWWQALGAMEKDLNRQKLFDTAKLTHTVQAKTVECAYNYYGIESQAIKDRWGTVLFSLIFYVLYTIWYGYGIMFVFEGLGFSLSAH